MNEISCIVFASAVLTLFFDYPFSNMKKLIFDSKRVEAEKNVVVLDENSNEVVEEKKKM